MQKDFTYYIYSELIDSLKKSGYVFLPFIDFVSNNNDCKKCVVIRHDVDRLPGNAFKMARMENGENVKASYYFRIVEESFDEGIIRKIAEMGHEIGYHYENLSLCGGNYELSIINFESNLEKFRKIYPVKTICMHGSPFSKWDNRDLWKKYDYRDFGIIAEPYFDVDFDEVFYITDTGRSWNNSESSVRDKVNSKFDIKIKDTNHLIEKIQNNELPDKIMINVHPQRWTDRFGPWLSELIKQNVKNVIKRYLLKFRD